MENPVRTAHYLAVMAERKRDLATRFEQLFSTAGDFVWEIGCGHGHFLTAYAEAHPEKLCIGIDIDTVRIARAQRKSQRAKLPNLHFIQAEARLFLEMLPAHARVADIFVLFPDPWPKARHSKHRILQPDFLVSLARRATPAGRLFFRTDYHPYFAEVAAAVAAHSGWEVIADPWPFEFETVFQSRVDIYYSLAARRATATFISSPAP
jgi:tRNA (guanine-N7-)-methyltransferase